MKRFVLFLRGNCFSFSCICSKTAFFLEEADDFSQPRFKLSLYWTVGISIGSLSLLGAAIFGTYGLSSDAGLLAYYSLCRTTFSLGVSRSHVFFQNNTRQAWQELHSCCWTSAFLYSDFCCLSHFGPRWPGWHLRPTSPILSSLLLGTWAKDKL